MAHVHLLPPGLVNQIAAGEVVERPASIVKELAENSLDAGATNVVIDIEEGGLSLVRIADDGSGMERDDAVLALERHTTSCRLATFGDATVRAVDATSADHYSRWGNSECPTCSAQEGAEMSRYSREQKALLQTSAEEAKE